jgi:pimeloyl-ACP methyl ester carboxylesterase
MGNRIEKDSSADPEQDLVGFVSQGIDHAGLLAMIAPRPAMLGFAQKDFFPIEGARETFDEAKRLYEAAGVANNFGRVEAPLGHGMTLPMRTAAYAWFGRWLQGKRESDAATEFAVTPRSAPELLVCKDGQVNMSFQSRPLLPLALEQFDLAKRTERVPLTRLLNLENDQGDPRLTRIAPGSSRGGTAILCVNGNETRDWKNESGFLDELSRRGLAVTVVDPRGVGERRPKVVSRGLSFSDPIDGVEENIAYNAFLTGKSLVGMRVADVVAAVRRVVQESRPERIVLCGRRDAALVACFAAAEEPLVEMVALEEMITSFRSLFSATAKPINAASIPPDLLTRFGDIAEVVSEIAPRRVLISAPLGDGWPSARHVQSIQDQFSGNPSRKNAGTKLGGFPANPGRLCSCGVAWFGHAGARSRR